MDMTLIQSAITGLNTAANIAKGFLQLKTITEVQGKVIELQSAILSAQSSALAAQSEQSTMIQRIRELEEEVARVKAWEETKQKYILQEVQSGTFAYALKEKSKGTEPPHWICTKCYEDGRKSILQDVHTEYVDSHKLVCSACEAVIPTPYGQVVPKYAT